MGGSDREYVAHGIELRGFFDGKDKFAGDFIFGEGPVDFAASEARDNLFIFSDEFRLFVTEEKGVTKAKSCSTLFAVVGGDNDMFTEGEFREHDG